MEYLNAVCAEADRALSWECDHFIHYIRKYLLSAHIRLEFSVTTAKLAYQHRGLRISIPR
jgi:hypothetical protein